MNTFLESVDNSTREAAGLQVLLEKGHIVNELCRVIANNEVALIVMGTTGGKSFLERFFGTTTESIIKKVFAQFWQSPKSFCLTH